ncbi:MAG TPA: AsmA family protein, partial [Nitrospirales bacterium]|nr:AsmA family protein [Nitrospirales bacterium]
MAGRVRRVRIALLGALALLLLAVIALSLFLAYDPDFFRALVLTQIEQQLGRHIEVREARLEIFPRVRVELLNVQVRDADGQRVFFTAERLALSLKAFALLRQQVAAKRLIIERPHLELRRDAGGRWNVLSGESGPGGAGNPVAMLLMIRDTTISDGTMRIVDEMRPDGVRQLDVRGVDASVSVESEGRAADIRITGTVPGPSRSATVALTGSLTHSDGPVRLDTDNTAVTGPNIHFDGQAEAVGADLRQVADFLGPRPLPERLHGTATLRAGISLVPGVVGYDLLLSKMTADIEGLAISGQASLSGIMAPQATFSVTFAASPITLAELLKRFPVQWLHPDVEAVIAERDVGGTVEVVSATLTGTAAPDHRYSVTGEFKVSRGRMLVGRERIPAQDVTATVFVEPDRMRVVDLSGAYGPLRITGGKALISSLDASPALELTVTGDIGAAELLTVLSKKIRYAPVAQTLGSFQDVKGDTALALRIAGPVKDPDQLKFVRAE